METLFYRFCQIGMFLVAVISYGWAYIVFYNGMVAAGFSNQRIQKINGRLWLIFVVWVILITTLSLLGFFSDFSVFPPRMLIVFGVPFVIILATTFSKAMKEILAHVAPETIIRIQVFRVFVEVLLYLLLLQNLLPVQMTLEGRNMDFLTGLTAPLFAWLIVRRTAPPIAILLWNIAGLLLLFNVMAIALLSMPTPFRAFLNEPAVTIVTKFPFIWLPGLLVPLAYGLHFVSIRQFFVIKK